MPSSTTSNIISKLTNSIDDITGNLHEDELNSISNTFDKTLNDALKVFNSNTFDDDGFIKKMRNLDLGNKEDKNIIENVLNEVKSDSLNIKTFNNSELLLRKDINDICYQMPEMHDVVVTMRDSIIECNVSTGQVSRSLLFENNQDNNETYESEVKGIENKHHLLMAIKNFLVPSTLQSGEMYIHVVPYAKLFAELEALKEKKYTSQGKYNKKSSTTSTFRESIPNTIMESFHESVSLFNKDNVDFLMEHASNITKVDSDIDYRIRSKGDKKPGGIYTVESVTKENISSLLQNIDIYTGSSIMMSEMGEEGFREFVMMEYSKNKRSSRETHFSEAMSSWDSKGSGGLFKDIDQDFIDFSSYNHIKGCYIKYLDPLKMIPIRIGRRIIGYYYVTTTTDLPNSNVSPNGIVDLSFQHYTKDRNLVEKLSSVIIRSFDNKMIERNINLKNEIAEIIMAHKFSEGKLSFIYIPENEIVRLRINEDSEGKGHSILEPSLFPARTYLMLTLYNIIYTLNNNTTRVHYLKSSGLNKDYAAQIQRTMRKFQSRRINIDDIYSYSGVLNKIGGMGEMVLPAGRSDYKALETDTIEAVRNPIDIEFLEQQRRQAISGTGSPNLLIINAIDEVDFAKTLEMANARYISAVSSYKIDFNDGFTQFYQLLMKYETDLEPEVIQSFRFMFNAIKQQELSITADMIQNYNSLVELTESIYYSKQELEDEKGNPTFTRIHLRKELAKEYLPQLDTDNLDDIVKRVNLLAKEDQLQTKVANLNISKEDLDGLSSEES